MLLKSKSADRVPEKNVREGKYDDTVENWLEDRLLWSQHSSVRVEARNFIVDQSNGCLYVKLTAHVTKYRWGSQENVNLWRVHDGWLRGEFFQHVRFSKGDVANNKKYRLVNLLYKLVKVDNTVPETWWNTDV